MLDEDLVYIVVAPRLRIHHSIHMVIDVDEVVVEDVVDDVDTGDVFSNFLAVVTGLRAWLSHLSDRLPPLSSRRFKPCVEHLISRGKSSSTLCRKSRVFSGFSSFLPQGKLTGWVRINSQENNEEN